jgi:hypothetical protein
MIDPTTLTVNAIAAIVFQEFIEGSVGKLAKKFTGDVIAQSPKKQSQTAATNT